jgi:hypothetical protein
VPTNPRLIELCRLWDKVTEEVRRMGLYAEGDYIPLLCRMDGDKAELRVGGAPGHVTHFDVRERRLEYYDTDEPVNRVMHRLLTERAGGKCRLEPREGVFCEEVGDLEEAFKVLGLATSMDFRIGEPERWYGPNFEKLGGACRDVRDPVEREICAAGRILEEVERRLRRGA